MPIIKSAKKRVRTSNKAAVRNSKTKRSLKSALKGFRAAVNSSSRDASAKHAKAQSELDKAVKKGVLHKKKASRLKKQAAAKSKAAGIKPAKATAKKAAPTKKTAATKRTAAKKPVAKKASAKKPAAKKK